MSAPLSRDPGGGAGRSRARAVRLHGARRPRRRRGAGRPAGRRRAVRAARSAATGAAAPSPSTSRPRRASRACCASPPAPTCWSRATARASPSASASAPRPARRSTPDSCTPGSPAGARTARWPAAPGTTSTTSRSPALLEPLGRAGERPHAPLNLLGDFAGGGMLLAVGVLAALLERERSGRGQVVDAAMVDGSALLTAMLHGMLGAGLWPAARREPARRRRTVLRHVPHGRRRLRRRRRARTGLLRRAARRSRPRPAPACPPSTTGTAGRRCGSGSPPASPNAPATSGRPSSPDVDACVAPVLAPAEAPDHPHNRAREAFVEVGGLRQPAPAPRFGRTPATAPRPPAPATVEEILATW